MKAENPAALRFIMQDDVYLLPNDKSQTNEIVTEAVIETPAVTFNYLGKHKKSFLVIVHYPDHDFIVDAHLTALQNILTRKDHSLDDVAIFNIAQYTGTNFEQLTGYFNPQRILVLGKNALPQNIPATQLNQPAALAGCMVLYSFSFEEMMDNTDHKRVFWEQMKNL